mmetsp:Transcript_31591/g.100659  ORF Transcript_31591/g.100659 Transcript_31591/m.100659 type:complete len:375 (+) Transcript_31591:1314-2438(+)
MKEELQAKDKALGRALSNYREEVLKWGSRLQALQKAKAEEAEQAHSAQEELRAEMATAVAEAAAAAAAAVQAERTRHATELEAALADSAREAAAWRERLELAERRGAAEATAAERGRSETSTEWRARLEEERLAGRDRLRAAEADGLAARQAAARAEAERDELASRLDLVQKELLLKSEHSTAVQTQARSAIVSASEHQALVTKLEQQLQASEREYRTAKAVRMPAYLRHEALHLHCHPASPGNHPTASIVTALRSVFPLTHTCPAQPTFKPPAPATRELGTQPQPCCAASNSTPPQTDAAPSTVPSITSCSHPPSPSLLTHTYTHSHTHSPSFTTTPVFPAPCISRGGAHLGSRTTLRRPLPRGSTRSRPAGR